MVSPEQLIAPQALLRSPFISQPPVQLALQLAQPKLAWIWGVTGSTAYALAGIPVIHATSDLDLLIRAPQPLAQAELQRWQQHISGGLCRADTQVDTPNGGFALAEWLRDGRVMLKTNHGPRLVSDRGAGRSNENSLSRGRGHSVPVCYRRFGKRNKRSPCGARGRS